MFGFNTIRAFSAPIIAFLMAGGLLTGGWYGLLNAVAKGMIGLMIPALGLSMVSATWWFPVIRWGYRKYVFPVAPSILPQPDSLQYVLNPASLIKAAMAVCVWFYAPLVQYELVRYTWGILDRTPAPINQSALLFTQRQFDHAEKNEPLESSHGIPYPLQQAAEKVAEKVVKEIKQAKDKAEKSYGASKSSSSSAENNQQEGSNTEEKADDASPGERQSSTQQQAAPQQQQNKTQASTTQQQQQQDKNVDKNRVNVDDDEKDTNDSGLRSRKQQFQDAKPSAPSSIYSQ